jgi:hypothetical protein
MGNKTLILLCILVLIPLTILSINYSKKSLPTTTPEIASATDRSRKYLVTYNKEYGPPTIQTYSLNPNQSLTAWLIEKDKTTKDPLCVNCFTVHSQTSYTSNKGNPLIIRETTSHPTGRSIRAYLTYPSDAVVEIFYLCTPPETPCSTEKLNQLKEVANTLRLSQK